MIPSLVAKKAVTEKLVRYSAQTFEELSGSKPSDKVAKLIKRNSRKLVKTIHAQIKKANKKLQKELKAQEKNAPKKEVKELVN